MLVHITQDKRHMLLVAEKLEEQTALNILFNINQVLGYYMLYNADNKVTGGKPETLDPIAASIFRKMPKCLAFGVIHIHKSEKIETMTVKKNRVPSKDEERYANLLKEFEQYV